MALGTIGSAIAGGLAKTAIGLGASKLFGGKKEKGFTPTGFSGGGLTGAFDPHTGMFNVTSSPGRAGVIGNLSSLFPQQADMVAGLRGKVAPGVGALTQSRLGELDSRARQSIGNLRDNLARRRVLGSSFGQDAIQRANLAFAQDADRIKAESFLQELDLTNQLIEQEYGLRREEFQTILGDMNMQAEMASGLATNASSQLAANSRLKTQLNAQSMAGAGRFLGQAFQPAIDSIFGDGGSVGTGGMGLFAGGLY